jgi:xylan 1,4-beta-xylosidase
VIASVTLTEAIDNIILGTEGKTGKISFFYTTDAGERIDIAGDIDATMLSTEVAGGFVGTQLGIHARREPWAQ